MDEQFIGIGTQPYGVELLHTGEQVIVGGGAVLRRFEEVGGAQEFDAVLFVTPGHEISRSYSQHFLDKNLELLLDQDGRCHVTTLSVEVGAEAFKGSEVVVWPEQEDRKSRSEALLQSSNIKINQHLPCIESAPETVLRTPAEIARRVVVLAAINLVAMDENEGEDVQQFLQDHRLWAYVTPDEISFLADPTPERKRQESWKCEAIYTLLWAINKIELLPFPDQICNLSIVDPDDYPLAPDRDPNDFINSVTTSRSKAEILDAADLYYRFDWACVDAQINNREVTSIHAGVVYERHYALNWLIRYGDQDWDDVSCDT